MTRGWLVGLGLFAVVGAACNPSHGTRASILPVSIDALETVVIVQDGTAIACRLGDEDGSVLLALPREPRPPICSWEIQILNLDPATLPKTQSADGVTWTEASVALRGSFDAVNRTLSLTEPPRPTSPTLVVPNPDLRRNPPCDPPIGGYMEEWGPNFRITNAAIRAALAYAQQESDTFAGAWADRTFFVYTMTFTGDLARHEAALAEIYDGPLCVWRHEHTRQELDEALASIENLDVPPGEDGPTLLRAQVDEIANRVHVLLWLTDEMAQVDLLGFDDLIEVSGWIEVTSSED